MPSVSIHPPKTPVTKGSMGVAAATMPNVCKMPGPPAPFVPTPLPNIAKSGDSPKGYSTSVKIEGNAVAIRGATFTSMGDMASKGTGGGLISSNTHGIAKFITPGSMTVKIQGKSVHLLGEPMLNNCGPSGNPPNAATMAGLIQGVATPGFAGKMGDKEIADQLCDAACKAMDDKRKQDAAGSGKKGYQQFMAERLSSGPPSYTPTANARILSEVTVEIPQTFGRPMQIVTSSTRTLAGSTAAAPTGLYGGLARGSQLGRGWTTRWDHVILNNPGGGCYPNNVSRFVEVKFPGDELTRNQRRTLIACNDSDFQKRVEMRPETDCACSES
jgi:uncharacterized Zn-binding protein involved in type VI secretion